MVERNLPATHSGGLLGGVPERLNKVIEARKIKFIEKAFQHTLIHYCGTSAK